MHVQHDLRRGFAVLVEKPLQNVNDELHRRVVVIQDQHAIEAGLLGLRLGARDDRVAGRVAAAAAPPAVVVRGAGAQVAVARLPCVLTNDFMFLRAVRFTLRAVDREMMPETAPRRNDDFYALPVDVNPAACRPVPNHRFKADDLNHSLQKLYGFQQTGRIEGPPAGRRSGTGNVNTRRRAHEPANMSLFAPRKSGRTADFIAESARRREPAAQIHNLSDILAIPRHSGPIGTDP